MTRYVPPEKTNNLNPEEQPYTWLEGVNYNLSGGVNYVLSDGMRQLQSNWRSGSITFYLTDPVNYILWWDESITIFLMERVNNLLSDGASKLPSVSWGRVNYNLSDGIGQLASIWWDESITIYLTESIYLLSYGTSQLPFIWWDESITFFMMERSINFYLMGRVNYNLSHGTAQ